MLPFENYVVFVSATRGGTPTDFDRSIKQVIKRNTTPFTVHAETVYNNTRSLSVVYNECLKTYQHALLVCFIHDDVIIDDMQIVDKLIKAHTINDIVGLAGGSDDQQGTPPLWHLMSSTHSGAVAHKHPSTDQVFMSSFGPTPSRVQLLDGLFLSVLPGKLKSANVAFDEDFDFHFYDLAFCKRAQQADLKMTTWPIWVIHKGLGDSCQSETWRTNAAKFITSYPNDSNGRPYSPKSAPARFSIK